MTRMASRMFSTFFMVVWHQPKCITQILTIPSSLSCRSCNTLLDFQFATGKITSGSVKKNHLGSSNAVTASTGASGTVTSTTTAVAAVATTESNKIPGTKTYEKVDPPDVEKLGRSSWTLLHSIAAKYPSKPTDIQKQEMSQFMTIFSHVYPCWWCAKDFERFIKANSPKVSSRDELGRWLCDAHNEVNEKIGKEKFNCNLWKNRWKDGWE